MGDRGGIPRDRSWIAVHVEGHKYFPMLRFGPGLAGLGISFECSFDAARITE